MPDRSCCKVASTRLAEVRATPVLTAEECPAGTVSVPLREPPVLLTPAGTQQQADPAVQAVRDYGVSSPASGKQEGALVGEVPVEGVAMKWRRFRASACAGGSGSGYRVDRFEGGAEVAECGRLFEDAVAAECFVGRGDADQRFGGVLVVVAGVDAAWQRQSH
jgi:hypothetical protein